MRNQFLFGDWEKVYSAVKMRNLIPAEAHAPVPVKMSQIKVNTTYAPCNALLVANANLALCAALTESAFRRAIAELL
uniref:Uncharacterized protein n=1 Tax=Trichuris muris TaxID=70415 RepID=A0A5S6QI97_TRIMR